MHPLRTFLLFTAFYATSTTARGTASSRTPTAVASGSTPSPDGAQPRSNAIDSFHELQQMVAGTASKISNSLMFAPAPDVKSGRNLPLKASGATGGGTNVASDLPTVTLLEDLKDAIGNSRQSCDSNPVSFIDGASTGDIVAAYTQYVDSIPTLSQALVARGRAWHPEYNSPVQNSIAAFAMEVYALSRTLAEANVTSEDSIVSTIRAAYTLVDAEAAWDKRGNLPG